MTNQIQTIQFHNQPIITMQQDETVFVAMKPICENIGLDWEAQFKRIKRDEVLNSTISMMEIVAEDGKKREMLCLPIDYLNGWLFGVDVKRVKPEIKDKLIQYKKECYQVLNDYWRKGFAGYSQVITITYDQVQELKQKVLLAARDRRRQVGDIRDQLFITFDIDEYSSLPANRFYHALDWLEGKYNPSGERPTTQAIPDDEPFFLSRQLGREFDARLHGLFDLADIIVKRYDDDVAKVFCKQAKAINSMLVLQDRERQIAV